MHDYNEQFEKAYSNDRISHKRKEGWSKFFLTHKENLGTESGFIRTHYDGSNDTRKQLVFAKDNYYRIMDIEIEYGMDDTSDRRFYNHNFETLEDAMQALKDFTVDTGYEMVFDRIAHQCYDDLGILKIPHDVKVDHVKSYMMMGSMDYQDKKNAIESAIAQWGIEDEQ